jgi:hypothetical protein
VDRPKLKSGDMHVSEQADSLVGVDAVIQNGMSISALEEEVNGLMAATTVS